MRQHAALSEDAWFPSIPVQMNPHFSNIPYTLLGLCLTLLLVPALVSSAVFGNVRGIIPALTEGSIPGAQVTIRSRPSDWSQNAISDTDGAFAFNAVPVGEYAVTVMASGFAPMEQQVTVISGSAAVLRFTLKIFGIGRDVEVAPSRGSDTAETSSPVSIVSSLGLSPTPLTAPTHSVRL